MRAYIVISHAYMSKGVVSSIKMIAGDQTQIDFICGYVDGNQDMDRVIRTKLDSMNEYSEIIIFTDLFGGSVNNAVLRVTGQLKNIHVITGVNLTLILGILLASEEDNIEEVIRENITEARNGMVYCNDLTTDNNELEDF
ncbi:MAG: hypothetical protein PHF63_06310 [Herbinix sp.]|nr:hypothetical protein [Herbinix sp.]